MPDGRSWGCVMPDRRLAPPQIWAWLAARDLTVEELWCYYAGITGNCALFEFEAALYGALILPKREYTVLAHAMWELEAF